MAYEPLSLAGSNTVQFTPAVRLASTGETWNQNLKHITMKRLTDAFGERKNRIYQTDVPLTQRLRDFTETHGYPEPEGTGTGTNRVRVCLLSNDPLQIVQLRREFRKAAPLQCTCDQWRLKDADQCAKEGLQWPPADMDREMYFVSKPDDGDGFGCSWHVYEDKVEKVKDGEVTTHKLIRVDRHVCNPSTCKYNKSDLKGHCKPVVEVNFRLGDWGGGELAFVHTESWATGHRIRTSLTRVFELTGGNPAGIEVDLVLEYTKAQRVPGSSAKKRQPYWVFDILHGMTETEFVEYSIERRRKVQTDRALLQGLNEGSGRLLEESRMSWRVGALLPEFRPELRGVTVADPMATETLADRVAAQMGVSSEAAQAALEANADDVDGLLSKLAVASHADADDSGALEDGTAEGVVEPDASPEPKPEEWEPTDADFTEGEFEVAEEVAPEPAAPAHAEVAVAEPALALEPVEPGPPMFTEMPESGFDVKSRFEELDEVVVFSKLIPKAWDIVVPPETREPKGKRISAVPTLATCKGDRAVFSAMIGTLLQLSETWWDETGRAKHVGSDE